MGKGGETYTRRDHEEREAFLLELERVLDRQHVHGGLGDFVGGRGGPGVAGCVGHGTDGGGPMLPDAMVSLTRGKRKEKKELSLSLSLSFA